MDVSVFRGTRALRCTDRGTASPPCNGRCSSTGRWDATRIGGLVRTVRPRMRLARRMGRRRRATLVRLEKGEQSPRFKTLDAIARALGRHATDLLVDPESTVTFPTNDQTP